MFDYLLNKGEKVNVTAEYHLMSVIGNLKDVEIEHDKCFVSNGLPLSAPLEAIKKKCKFHNDHDKRDPYSYGKNKYNNTSYLKHSRACASCNVYKKIINNEAINQYDMPDGITITEVN